MAKWNCRKRHSHFIIIIIIIIIVFIYLFIYFSRKSWRFMWIVCLADDSHEMPRQVSFSAAVVESALRVKKKKSKCWWYWLGFMAVSCVDVIFGQCCGACTCSLKRPQNSLMNLAYTRVNGNTRIFCIYKGKLKHQNILQTEISFLSL